MLCELQILCYRILLFLQLDQLFVIFLKILWIKCMIFFFSPDSTIISPQIKTLSKTIAWQTKNFIFWKCHTWKSWNCGQIWRSIFHSFSLMSYKSSLFNECPSSRVGWLGLSAVSSNKSSWIMKWGFRNFRISGH